MHLYPQPSTISASTSDLPTSRSQDLNSLGHGLRLSGMHSAHSGLHSLLALACNQTIESRNIHYQYAFIALAGRHSHYLFMHVRTYLPLDVIYDSAPLQQSHGETVTPLGVAAPCAWPSGLVVLLEKKDVDTIDWRARHLLGATILLWIPAHEAPCIKDTTVRRQGTNQPKTKQILSNFNKF